MFTFLSTKSKLIILLFLIVLALSAVLYSVINLNQKLSKDNNRLITNVKNQNFTIDTLKTKNGEMAYSVTALKVKSKEFSLYNAELNEKVKNLNLKVKNLQNVSEVTIKYVFVKDSTPLVPIVDPANPSNQKKFAFNFDDKYIQIGGIVVLSKNPFVENLQAKVTDSLLFANEIKYKGWWFWKRPVSMKLIIKSENPYFQLNTTKTYNFVNNNGSSK